MKAEGGDVLQKTCEYEHLVRISRNRPHELLVFGLQLSVNPFTYLHKILLAELRSLEHEEHHLNPDRDSLFVVLVEIDSYVTVVRLKVVVFDGKLRNVSDNLVKIYVRPEDDLENIGDALVVVLLDLLRCVRPHD